MERTHGDLFAVKCRRLGAAAGNTALACNMFELQPGKTAMPFHFHHANEEAMYVLAGTGTLRIADERHPVRQGDYVAFVTGKDAHQLTNTGSDPLRYLMLSTQNHADVMVYPDSDKVGFLVGSGKETFARFFPEQAKVDYWQGEPVGDGKPDADDDAEAPGEDEEDLEQRIDDEIAALKAKLGLARDKGETKKTHGRGPKKGTTARKVVDDALDELERLKRKLDG